MTTERQFKSQKANVKKQKWPDLLLTFAFCLLTFDLPLHAASGSEGAAFLEIPVGAGPAALGSAYSALAHDAYAPIYNPAGLGFVNNTQLAAQHLSYLESINYEFGSLVTPLKANISAFGASIQYLGSGSINRTEVDSSGAAINNGDQTGTFSSYFASYNLAYGQKVLERLALGVTGKMIRAKIDDVSASAYALDLGGLYKANDKLNLSATVNNLGTKINFLNQSDPLPLEGHVGAAYDVRRNITTTAEVVYSKSGLASGRFGAEWTPLEAISLRTGYKTETTKGLSALAGLTVGLGLHLFGQEFAYAWLPYGDLGDTQYFSLLLKFGAHEEARRNLIQYQSIKAHRSVKSKTAIDKSATMDPEYQQLMQLLQTNDAHVARANSTTLDE